MDIRTLLPLNNRNLNCSNIVSENSESSCLNFSVFSFEMITYNASAASAACTVTQTDIWRSRSTRLKQRCPAGHHCTLSPSTLCFSRLVNLLAFAGKVCPLVWDLLGCTEQKPIATALVWHYYPYKGLVLGQQLISELVPDLTLVEDNITAWPK